MRRPKHSVSAGCGRRWPKWPADKQTLSRHSQPKPASSLPLMNSCPAAGPAPCRRPAASTSAHRAHQRHRRGQPDKEAHGPAQAEDPDRPGVGVEHLRTGDHRSRRQGAHRQGRRAPAPAQMLAYAMPQAHAAAGRRRRAPPRRPPPAAAEAPPAETGHVVKSPMVGTFYRAVQPGRQAAGRSRRARSRKASRSASSKR